MNFEHYDRFFLLTAVGLGLFFAGAMNLAFGVRAGRRVALRAVVSLAMCGLVAAGLFALGRPALAARAAGVLGGVLVVAALFNSEWLHRSFAALFAALRKPTVRWGLLTVAGLALVIGSAIGFESADEALIEKDTLDLEMATGQPPRQASERARASTDRGTSIVLKEPVTPRDSSALIGPEEKVIRSAKLTESVIRRGEASDNSNCHGWVFTGGKFLLGPDDVEAILKDNGYTETHEPHAGDLVIYRQNGAVAHSAVVRYVSEGQPVMVEGKWGVMGVFLHNADKSCYGTDYRFYRSARQGHLLVGVGGTSPNPNAETPTVTE